jgi:hypothetical protein
MLSGPRVPLRIPPEPPPEDADNEPDGAVDGPRYLGEVTLARCRGKKLFRLENYCVANIENL